MYHVPKFHEDRIEILHALMTAHPFATLVTTGPDGPVANHMPLVLHRDAGPHGTLRGHVARPNPLSGNHDPATAALAIFQGPDSYISPAWYPAKQVHGKVVPTWNYAVVHARGPLRFVEDQDWLRAHLEELTNRQEHDRPEPWAVGDAPDDFIARMLKGIVGIELLIEQLVGKWKVSQNRGDEDRAGVARGLREERSGSGEAMARLVEHAS